MKRTILLAALAASFSIHADTIEAPNTRGGKIVLTDKQGTCAAGQLLAYDTLPNGTVTFGCWVMVDDRFFVRYNNGNVRVYETDGFEAKLSPDSIRKPARSKGM